MTVSTPQEMDVLKAALEWERARSTLLNKISLDKEADTFIDHEDLDNAEGNLVDAVRTYRQSVES